MKRSKITGFVGTIMVHALLLALLIFYTLDRPEQQEEGGVPVMLGDTQIAQGEGQRFELTEVDVIPQEEVVEPEPMEPEPVVEQPLITQTEEPSVAVKEEKPKQDKVVKPEKKKVEKKKKEDSKVKPQPKPEVKPEKPVQQKPKEKTEAEKKAEAEKAAAKIAAGKIAGAFGKGSQMSSSGKAASGDGLQGSPNGNAVNGKTSGEGGSGSFSLDGRSLGPGGLPLPVYNVQEAGRVVVSIVVDPSGKVIGTSIHKHTNTVNAALRKAALDAAKKARFNAVDKVDNQIGTITYYFNLK